MSAFRPVNPPPALSPHEWSVGRGQHEVPFRCTKPRSLGLQVLLDMHELCKPLAVGVLGKAAFFVSVSRCDCTAGKIVLFEHLQQMLFKTRLQWAIPLGKMRLWHTISVKTRTCCWS